MQSRQTLEDSLYRNLSSVPAAVSQLPPKPLVRIKSSRRWGALNLRELWNNRDLFYFLMWRDVKVRYKQTALGVAWVALQPLLTMAIFTVIFGRLAHLPSDGQPYPIFVYAGLLPWNFFANAVTTSSNSLVGNATLITKVYFPRLVIPGAAVGAGLVDLAIAGTILLAMCFYYHVTLGWRLVMLAPLTVLLTVFAAAVGLWMSAMNVKYRDVRYVLPFLIQVWMYLTPIIYPINFIPARWRWALMLNPLSGIVEAFRSAIFNQVFNWSGLATAAIVAVSFFVYAAYDFRRMERVFADII
ncbi:MAG TPA: ABC transporter permease [Candidatus Binataceae bacterium]|nr:ABC transporter permease [Candidatus Binataceae bacterium]